MGSLVRVTPELEVPPLIDAGSGPSGSEARSAAVNDALHVLLVTVAPLLRLPSVAMSAPEPGPWSVRSEFVLAMLSCGPPRTMWFWSTALMALAEKGAESQPRLVADSAMVVPSPAINVAGASGFVGQASAVPVAVKFGVPATTVGTGSSPPSSSTVSPDAVGAEPLIWNGLGRTGLSCCGASTD